MRAPGFWWQSSLSLTAWLLLPFSRIYSFFASKRLKQLPRPAGVPVICIGNFTAGGAGKTPTAIKLCQMLHMMGEKPFVLSRGYGGTESGPLLVNAHNHLPQQVGDEPLLLARHAPVVVSRDRVAGAEECRRQGASVIIMDDGMQNPSLRKNLTFAVIDGRKGIGNGQPLPAGPLRLPMDRQWPLANALILVGDSNAATQIRSEAQDRGKPVFEAVLRPDEKIADAIRGKRVLAFAGVGSPDKFFDTLRSCGALVEQTRAFPDHHVFSETELGELIASAASSGLILITTEKDAMRIPGHLAENFAVLPVALSFTDENAVKALMTETLQQFRAGQ